MSDTKYLTVRSLISIAIPLTIVILQALVRYSADKDFDTIGITLSSIAMGQIFPYIIFESFLLGKVFGLKEESQFLADGKLSLTYQMENKDSVVSNIKKIRLLSYFFFLITLLLFIITIILNFKGEIAFHILTGFLSCIVIWYFNLAY